MSEAETKPAETSSSPKTKDSDSNIISQIPSELRLTYKWDGCVERAIVNTTVGTVVGGLASVVLFSKKLPSETTCEPFKSSPLHPSKQCSIPSHTYTFNTYRPV